MKRENEALERYKSLHENRLRLAQEEMKKINESAEARQNFINNYHAIIERKALKESQHSKLMEAARNDALATVIKAIYITALEAESLMDENILLAENMVDRWIEEAGGASKILAKTGNNTYLLSRITQIVEEAAEEAVKEIEEPEEEANTNEVPDENASKEVQIAQLTAKDAEIKAQIANLKAEKKAEEEEKSEEEAEKDTEPATETPAEEEPKEDEDGKETSDTPEEEVPAEGEEKSEEESEDDKEESDTPDEATTEEDGETEEEEVDADIEIKDVPAEDSDNTEELPKEEEEKSNDNSETSAEEESEAPTDGSEETAPSEAEGEETPADGEESEDAPKEAEGEEGSDEDDVDPDTDISMNDDEKELTDDEVDPDEDASEDDDVNDSLGEPLDGNDGTDVDTTVDGDTENKGKIFDDLENEDDVQKAIELIRTRVADAEETFIRNNAEDKKKIDELLNKISTNVKTVETLSEKDPKKAQVATEAVREYKRKINDVYREKSFTVFGKMANILTENIVKDNAIRESYMTEDGTLDVDLAVESAKVMYGFLETLNTIQIEKVDEKYIANIINGMR